MDITQIVQVGYGYYPNPTHIIKKIKIKKNKKKTSLTERKPQKITNKLKSKLCKMKRNKPRGREWGPS